MCDVINGGTRVINRILIIDDDKELCALIKRSVLQESIEADCCYSGKSALLQLKEKISACHIGCNDARK